MLFAFDPHVSAGRLVILVNCLKLAFRDHLAHFRESAEIVVATRSLQFGSHFRRFNTHKPKTLLLGEGESKLLSAGSSLCLVD